MGNRTLWLLSIILSASAALAQKEDDIVSINAENNNNNNTKDTNMSLTGHHYALPDDLPTEAKYFKWPDEDLAWTVRVHIFVCFISFVFILPVGLTMEYAHYKFQSLVQVIGAAVSLVGIIFGLIHGHLGNVYARFGWFVLSWLIIQTLLNVGIATRLIRRTRLVEIVYRTIYVLQIVFTYMACVFGVITYLGLCSHGHLGQCISHIARGSVFMAVSILTLISIRVYGPVVMELKRPIEFYECIAMIIVGIIGTFTEHNFFMPAKDDSWSHKDLQHTLIGISWFCAGITGILMMWKSHPKNRSMIPALVFIITGIAMIIHEQDMDMSSYVHYVFGLCLCLLGFTAIIENTLVASGYINPEGEVNNFQYVPIYFMCTSGIFLAGANRDIVMLLINTGIDIGTYGLTMASFCFLIILYCYIMTDIYRYFKVPLTGGKYHNLSDNETVNYRNEPSTSLDSSILNINGKEDDDINLHNPDEDKAENRNLDDSLSSPEIPNASEEGQSGHIEI